MQWAEDPSIRDSQATLYDVRRLIEIQMASHFYYAPQSFLLCVTLNLKLARILGILQPHSKLSGNE